MVELLSVLRNGITLFNDEAGDTPIEPRGDCCAGTVVVADSAGMETFCIGGGCEIEDLFAWRAGGSVAIFSTRGSGAKSPC